MIPVLRDRNLLLRPIRTSDVPAVFRGAGNVDVCRFMSWERHKNIADSELFVREYAFSNYASDIPDPFAIELLPEDRGNPTQFCGVVGCNFDDARGCCMELGYWLCKEFWGQGIATRAASLLIRHVFQHYPVERVFARCVTENVASARVLEKLGMLREGCLRQMPFRDEGFRDLFIYALLRSEWERDQSQ